MRLVRYTLILLFASALAACGYDDHGTPIASGNEPLPANMALGTLMELYAGEPALVSEDLTVAGYVSANDRSGNFYRTFIIQDGSGAMEIRAGLYDLHSVFPVGRYVAVKLRGLAIGTYDGVLQAGLPVTSDSGYDTDYFDYMPVMERYVFPADDYVAPTVAECLVGELEERMCGMLVQVADVIYVPEEGEAGIPAWGGDDDDPLRTGYRMFEERDGERVCVATSGYADFAADPVPSGRVTIRGILTYGKAVGGKKMFMLKLRDTDDLFY